MPAAPLRLALAQSLSVPGEVESNVRAATETIGEAADRGAQLVVFPELFLTGYELTHLAEHPRSWIEPERETRAGAALVLVDLDAGALRRYRGR
jgi:predicted amidohydrolase